MARRDRRAEKAKRRAERAQAKAEALAAKEREREEAERQEEERRRERKEANGRPLSERISGALSADRLPEDPDEDTAGDALVRTLHEAGRQLRERVAGDTGREGALTELDKAVKPKEFYVFHSDYFEVDKEVSCILALTRQAGAEDELPAWWGVDLVPDGMPEGVRSVNYASVRRMSDRWVEDHLAKAEGVLETNENAQAESGSMRTKGEVSSQATELRAIMSEHVNGAPYLQVKDRVQLFAPDVETLDDALDKLGRLYTDRFKTLKTAAFEGEQRRELSTLYGAMERKRGEGFFYTSTEYAGNYSLVTHGLEDTGGIYVGFMTGDLNTSAVLFDVDGFGGHVVVADGSRDSRHHNQLASDVWGQRIAQEALCSGHRVVQLVLNEADLDRCGAPLRNSTARVNMASGDINMFEVFGDPDDQQRAYSMQIRKLVLMAEQVSQPEPSERAMFRSVLQDVLDIFYKQNRLWRDNAEQNKGRLRAVGLYHDQVPRLEVFSSYLAMRKQAQLVATARDEENLHALKVLDADFQAMLTNNGDLFNKVTSDEVDRAAEAKRAVYDFSGVAQRGAGLAMAQLVNALGFALSGLGEGDVVIIHGAERIDDGVKPYVSEQLRDLRRRGGRVCYCYGQVEEALQDARFCDPARADYLVLGTMPEPALRTFKEAVGAAIPKDLAKEVTKGQPRLSYIRRGLENVCFMREI